jgi:zinc D-Ala-D-Ala carboxypeptidase
MASSAHFSDRELGCRHCGVNKCTPELVLALETFRAVASERRGADTPVIVDDAYRCPEYNRTIPNAATHSQHQLGTAADVRIEGATSEDLYRWALEVPQFAAGGIGRNDHVPYIHLDVRGGGEARWCYDAGGKTVAWFEPKSDGPVVA